MTTLKRLLSVILALVFCLSILTSCGNQDFNLEDSEYNLNKAMNTDSLKELCKDYFMLGVGLTGNAIGTAAVNSPEYMAVTKTHFNSVTLTNLMKPTFILDQEKSIESAENGDGMPAVKFDSVDPTLEWCYENGVQMRGHTLVWHTQTPDWFFRVGYENGGDYVDYDTMAARLDSYIQQVLTYVQKEYPGVIYCWDVVNEAVDPGSAAEDSFFDCRTKYDNGKDNPWYMTLGEDYVELAFTSARKYADEDVKLFYNDFNTYQYDKRFNIYKLCDHLNDLGLIDGVGMQGYWGIGYPSLSDLEDTINNFADLGLEIHITELSIGVDNLSQENLEIQADRYAEIFEMFARLDTQGSGKANITSVTLFGLMDGFVMYESDDSTTRLFDTNFQPKPCFYSIQKVLKDSYK